MRQVGLGSKRATFLLGLTVLASGCAGETDMFFDEGPSDPAVSEEKIDAPEASGGAGGASSTSASISASANASTSVSVTSASSSDASSSSETASSSATATSSSSGESACAPGCEAGEICTNGACKLFCAGGTTRCGDACVDVKVDPQNCGACGDTCAEGDVCSDGICTQHCGGGTTMCEDRMCVSLIKDKWNCGACGNICPEHEVCYDGLCSLDCFGDTTRCGDLCISLGSDPQNCGACGEVCPGAPNAAATCVDATCDLACVGSFRDCNESGADGCEADIASDVESCGACNVACEATPNAEPICVDGACGAACHADFAECDGDVSTGCEVALQDDRTNCGACGAWCATNEICVEGACQVPSFVVGDGPAWITEPPTYSCVEACAFLFGGPPVDWSCSIDADQVTHTAWLSGYASDAHCPEAAAAPDTFKAHDTYDAPGAFSAYVADHCTSAVNYCFAR